MDPFFILAIIYIVYRIVVKLFFFGAEHYRRTVNELIRKGVIKQDINGQLYYGDELTEESDEVELTVEREKDTYLGYVDDKFVCQSHVLEELVIKVQKLYPTKKVHLIDNV